MGERANEGDDDPPPPRARGAATAIGSRLVGMGCGARGAWGRVGVARFIDASIYRDTFPAIRIAS